MNSTMYINVIASPMLRGALSQRNVRNFYSNNHKTANMCLRATLMGPHQKQIFTSTKLLTTQVQSNFYGHQTLRTFFAASLQSQAKSEGSNIKKVEGLADELLGSMKTEEKANIEKEQEAQRTEEKQRTVKALKYTTLSMAAMIIFTGGLTVYTWGAPNKDEHGNDIQDKFTDLPLLKQYLYRTYAEACNMSKMIQEPIRDKLLPDPIKYPYMQPPYTLVLELKDVLVHPEWTYGTGWRFKKRPGVDFLLQHCGPPLFEIVIFSNENAFTSHPVLDQLDKSGLIWYRLFREATRYENGKHYKDLYGLNRDLNKVIALDWDPEAITAKRNHLVIKRWDGDMKDETLIDLALMLRTIAESEVSDVREVLDYYRTFDDPIAAFKENQRAAMQFDEERQKNPVADQGLSRLSGFAKPFLGKR